MPAFANVEQQQQAQTAAKVEQVKLDVAEGKAEDPDVTGALDDMPDPVGDSKAARKSVRGRDKHDAHRAAGKADHHAGKREVERTPAQAAHDKGRA